MTEVAESTAHPRQPIREFCLLAFLETQKSLFAKSAKAEHEGPQHTQYVSSHEKKEAQAEITLGSFPTTQGKHNSQG